MKRLMNTTSIIVAINYADTGQHVDSLIRQIFNTYENIFGDQLGAQLGALQN